VSPRSRGRPPGRGRRRQPGARPAGRPGLSGPAARPATGSAGQAGQAAGCWFDEPSPGGRQSWAVPSGQGTYRGLDLELLDPTDDDELGLILEAMHPEYWDALARHEQVVADNGEPVDPTLHVTLHQVVARQILSGEPAETWHTVQRLAGMGYDWHNVMHMIAAVVGQDIYHAVKEHRTFDRADFVRRLDELPGDWPPPHSLGPQ
jgi:hypothetical protein